jgi:hypothetical protein
MLNQSIRRAFASSAKNVCILANGRQADLTGSKIISSLKTVAGDTDVNFYGYGGAHMKAEGFNNTFDVDMDMMLDKTFHTFRRSRVNSEANYHKWNPFNLVNRHYTRHSNQIHDLLDEQDLTKRIYQSRPHMVLNIGNEYLSLNLMEQLASKYHCLFSLITHFLLNYRLLQEFRSRNAKETFLH